MRVPKKTWVHEPIFFVYVIIFVFILCVLSLVFFDEWYEHGFEKVSWQLALTPPFILLSFISIIYWIYPNSNEIRDYDNFKEALTKVRKAAREKEVQEAMKLMENKQN